MTAPTHHHDYRPGHTYLESEHPDYLKIANGNVEDAENARIKLIDDCAPYDEQIKAWNQVQECERAARDAYVRYSQANCTHKVTRTYHAGSQYMVQCEHYDDDTEGPTECVNPACRKIIG